MDKSDVCVTLFIVGMFTILMLAIGFRDLGDTSVIGYVLTYQHREFPVKTTIVVFSYGHPKSLVTIETFTRTFAGWEEFELESMYRIKIHRGVFELYPTIVEKVEVK